MEQIIANNIEKFFSYNSLNPIQDWLSLGCSRLVGGVGGGRKKAPLPKICRTNPTMMKLGRVMPYLKKI